jgi:hypothetical protein
LEFDIWNFPFWASSSVPTGVGILKPGSKSKILAALGLAYERLIIEN